MNVKIQHSSSLNEFWRWLTGRKGNLLGFDDYLEWRACLVGGIAPTARRCDKHLQAPGLRVA